MPYKLNWPIENEIINVEFSGVGGPEELREALTGITEMRNDTT